MTQVTCLAETDREELSMNQNLMEGIMTISWGTWPTVVYSFLRPAWTVEVRGVSKTASGLWVHVFIQETVFTINWRLYNT